jgi:branched-chain amino acid transport system ATP-binding protein
VLRLDKVTASYDLRTAVLNEVDLKVERGQIVALIGANGAGKTTTMRVITGLLKPVSGRVQYADQVLSALPAHKIVAQGIALVPEGRRVFPKLTVQENLEVGCYPLHRQPGRLKQNLGEMFGLFPVLSERRSQRAETLSGGEQQMLALGRALMSKPSMLLLDEPSLGVAPQVVQRIYGFIAQINRQGVSILLVEQNATLALKVSTYAYVMQMGKIVLEGPSEVLCRDPRVEAAYLGTLRGRTEGEA